MHRMKPSCIRISRIFVTLALLVSAAAGQESPTFRSQTNLVLVPALVRDADGRPVCGLQARDFLIDDDGVEQAVQLDDTAESAPVSLVIAIQRGRRASYEFPRLQSLYSVLEPILGQPETQVALVEFDSTVELTQYFTSDTKLISEDLKKLQPGDRKAAILDAVYFSEKLLDKVPKERQRVLLLISETRDHGSIWARKIDDVVTLVGTSNTTVYTLAFSPSVSNVLDTMRGNNIEEMNAGPDYLAVLKIAAQAMRRNAPKTIASLTGGEYALFETRSSFEDRMLDFTNHLQSRYLLSFEPKDPHLGLHTIRVALKKPSNVTVLARSRYWAAGASR
jgi:VWFA-related protein